MCFISTWLHITDADINVSSSNCDNEWDDPAVSGTRCLSDRVESKSVHAISCQGGRHSSGGRQGQQRLLCSTSHVKTYCTFHKKLDRPNTVLVIISLVSYMKQRQCTVYWTNLFKLIVYFLWTFVFYFWVLTISVIFLLLNVNTSLLISNIPKINCCSTSLYYVDVSTSRTSLKAQTWNTGNYINSNSCFCI